MSGPTVNVYFEGKDEWKAALDGLVERASNAARNVVAKGGLLVEKAAKEHANGRPGPMVRTGTLRRSITVLGVTALGPTRWMSQVAPTVAYGRRIELGFSGTDAIGRQYGPPKNPARYPFMAPAVEDSSDELAELYEAEFTTALEG